MNYILYELFIVWNFNVRITSINVNELNLIKYLGIYNSWLLKKSPSLWNLHIYF